jgi:hypothetical protein
MADPKVKEDVPKEDIKAKPKKITPSVLTEDLDAYKKYCSGESSSVCESFVQSYNENKQKSAELTKSRITGTFASLRSIGLSILVLGITGILIWAVITWLVPFIQGLPTDLDFESISPMGNPQ